MIQRSTVPILLAIGLAITFTASTALAAPTLTGAWSTTVPGQGGTTQVTEAFDADGSYVSVRREPNGTMLRIWGSYQVTSISSKVVRLESHIQGWMPRQICAQAPGFAVKCSPFTPPSPPPVALEFLSGDAFQVGGIVVRRDPEPELLRQNVAERLVLAAPAPVQPIVGPPGGGGGGRYVTPRDPTAVPGRDDLQQRRICSINGGSLVVVSGRLTCVN